MNLKFNLFMKNLPILISLITMFLLSCTKEASTENEKINEQETFKQFAVTKDKFEISSRFLKREVFYLSNNPLLKQVRMFSYDVINRCTEIRLGTIDSSASNPQFQLTQTLTFTYDDNSLLPASVASVRSVFPDLVTNFYYMYNNLGLKIMDSVRVKNLAGEPADRKIHYEYVKNKVYTTPMLTGFPMDYTPTDTLDLLYGGNIGRLASRRKHPDGDRIIVYTFTYDNKISPYSKMNLANSLYFVNSAIGLGYNVPLETHYMGVTANNMTSWTTGSYTVRFNYAYDNYGYPVQKEMFFPGDSLPYWTINFEY